MCPTLSWTKSRGHLIVIQVHSAYKERWLSPSLIWTPSFYCVKLLFHLPVPFGETDSATTAFGSPQIDTVRDNTAVAVEQNSDIENHLCQRCFVQLYELVKDKHSFLHCFIYSLFAGETRSLIWCFSIVIFNNIFNNIDFVECVSLVKVNIFAHIFWLVSVYRLEILVC